MKKGKGYPEHVKDTGKSFGDAYAQDVTGGPMIVTGKLRKIFKRSHVHFFIVLHLFL